VIVSLLRQGDAPIRENVFLYSLPPQNEYWLRVLPGGGKAVGLDFSSVTIGTLGLRFYRLDDHGNPTPLLETWPPPADETTYNDNRQQIRYPPFATHPWLDTTHQTITPSDVPPFLASSPLAPSLLCFWTSVATLRIEDRGWDDYHAESRIILSDVHGDVEFAGLWGRDVRKREQERDQGLNLPEYGKFIVVGAVRQRMSHGGRLTLKLLMVETDEGEAEGGMVCRRRYLITEVMESEWERLQGTQRWELVFLAWRLEWNSEGKVTLSSWGLADAIEARDNVPLAQYDDSII
jgi:hypothetical protein